MALVACPECGQNVSSEAPQCVHCGMPLDPRRTKIDYVTGEPLGITPRPAAQEAPRPMRYPSPAGAAMMLLGAGLVIVGSFMPWVRLGPLSVSGMQSDGRVTVAVGIVMLALALAARSSASRGPRLLVTAAAVIVSAIAAVDNTRLREGLPDNLIGAGVGTVFIGGIIAFIGSFLLERRGP